LLAIPIELKSFPVFEQGGRVLGKPKLKSKVENGQQTISFVKYREIESTEV